MFNPYKLKNIRYLVKNDQIKKEMLKKYLKYNDYGNLYNVLDGDRWINEKQLEIICNILDKNKEEILDEVDFDREQTNIRKKKLRNLLYYRKNMFEEDVYYKLYNDVKNAKKEDLYELEHNINLLVEQKDIKLKKEKIELKKNKEKEKLLNKTNKDYVKLNGLIFLMSKKAFITYEDLVNRTGIDLDKIVKYQALYDCPVDDAIKIANVIGVDVEKLMDVPEEGKCVEVYKDRNVINYAIMLYKEYRNGELIYSLDYAWRRACCAFSFCDYYRTPAIKVV